MLHPVTSDLGLHCLPVILLGVSRLKWVVITEDVGENWDNFSHFSIKAYVVGTPQPLYNTIVGSIVETVLVKQPCYIQTKCIDYVEK